MLSVSAEITRKIAQLDKKIGRAELAVGAEIRALMVLEDAGVDERVQGVPKAYYRPAQEVFLLAYWSKLAGNSMTENDFVELVSLMCGATQSFRAGPMNAVSPGGKEFHFSVDPPDGWIDKIQRHFDQVDDPIDLAVEVFYDTVWDHPFTDGNGRLSRGLIQSALASKGYISAPILGLGGAFWARASRINGAFAMAASGEGKGALRNEIATALALSVELQEKCFGIR